MKKRICFGLFFVLFGATICANDAGAAVSSTCGYLGSKSGGVAEDTKLKGRNCREREALYIQHPTTKTIKAVLSCTSCYEGFTLTSKTGTTSNDCSDISYSTCVQNGLPSGVVFGCQSATCSGTPVAEIDTIWADPTALIRAIESVIKCFKGRSIVGGGGSSDQIRVVTIGCNNYPDEVYDETYKVSLYSSDLRCSASVQNCIPKYDSYCPAECPFLGWGDAPRSSKSHYLTRCVKIGTLSGRCEYSCANGYQLTTNGCEACTSNMICIVGQEAKCKSGFWGAVSTSTNRLVCSACPSVKNADDVVVYGKSVEGATSITQCYLSSGSYKDRTGTFTVTSNCYYSNS